ncbi:MAG: enhanced intracellular survival protein Eis [Promethearchaeota archaeon]
MDIVKKMPNEDIGAFLDIFTNAYPGEAIPLESKENIIERWKQVQIEVPEIDFYGLYRDGQLQGGMRIHDYTMNFFSKKMRVMGVGAIAVDLLYKKEKVCKEMVSYFHKHCKNNGVYVSILYPFRSDFYKKMGYGYGTKMNRYQFSPNNLPRGRSKSNIRYLQKEDAKVVLDCYNRYVERTHGTILRTERDILRLITNPRVKVVGYLKEEQCYGYLVFTFEDAKKGNWILNNIVIREFIYENTEALLELTGFLHTQEDQIHRIIFSTQEENFHFLLKDPRNDSNHIFKTSQETNQQGLGIMYRVLDTEKFFKQLSDHNFNNQTCKLRLSITDTFLTENHGSVIVHFENGQAKVKEDEFEVEISLDVSEFSSLVMGVITFKELYHYGLVKISNPAYGEAINNLFLAKEKPICLTQF